MLVLGAWPIFQDKGGDAKRIEKLGNGLAFVLIGETAVATAGTNNDPRARVFVARRQIDGQRRFVRRFGTYCTRCALRPEQFDFRRLARFGEEETQRENCEIHWKTFPFSA